MPGQLTHLKASISGMLLLVLVVPEIEPLFCLLLVNLRSAIGSQVRSLVEAREEFIWIRIISPGMVFPLGGRNVSILLSKYSGFLNSFTREDLEITPYGDRHSSGTIDVFTVLPSIDSLMEMCSRLRALSMVSLG